MDMFRAHSRRAHSTIANRARHVLVAAVGAALLVGLFGAGAAGSSQLPAGTDTASHSTFVVQHDATITVGASNTNRSPRLVTAGAFLILSGLAAIAARRMESRRGRALPRRIEDLHARLRGPPALLVVAH
jgi:hypothetical protein